MSAVRKTPYQSESLNAGHRMTWLMEVMAPGATPMSADARAFLHALVLHHGEGACCPGFRRLGEMTGLGKNRMGAARDELRELGLISWYDPPGRLSSHYRLVALEAWFEARMAPKVCVPPKPVCVPVEAVCVPTGGTEPLEPINQKKAGVVLKIVPKTGWVALVEKAPTDIRTLWLERDRKTEADRITVVSEGPEGLRLRAATSLIRDRVEAMVKRGQLHDIALEVGIDPEKLAIEGPRHAREAPQQVLSVTPMGMNEMAGQIEEKSDVMRVELVGQPIDGRVTSLAAFRARNQQDGNGDG